MSIFWNKMTKISRSWTFVILLNNIIIQTPSIMNPVTYQ